MKTNYAKEYEQLMNEQLSMLKDMAFNNAKEHSYGNLDVDESFDVWCKVTMSFIDYLMELDSDYCVESVNETTANRFEVEFIDGTSVVVSADLSRPLIEEDNLEYVEPYNL